MFKRYATAVTTGSLMTFALLFVMHLLISIQPSAAATHPTSPLTLHATPPPEKPVQPRPKRIDRKTLTQVERVPRSVRSNPIGPGTGIAIPTTSGLPTFERLRPMQNLDGPMVAMIRVSPSYPSSATARGLEGYTIVEFDVLTNGTTTNIRVIKSSHAIFEKPSIKAAERFKFKPRVVDGQPQTSTGIQNIFRYEMDTA